MTQGARTVSLIVPCRNERGYIEAFCASALAQRLPPDRRLELVIADGQSDDGTREVLDALALRDARVAVIANPRRIVSTGLNLALAQARGDVIVRMDVHTEYAPDYVAQCLAALELSGAANVGGPWRAEAGPQALPMQQAVAAAFQSRWVAGGARSRDLTYSGEVDTVYLGCWPRATFERFGGFDEDLVRNQDDEHNLRIVRGGGRIWQSAAVRSVYRPRARLGQVFRQYLQYGYWKPFVMKKHGQPASLRHLVPALFVAALGLSLLPALAGLALPLVALAVLYAATVVALTAGVAAQLHPSPAALVRVPAVIAAYHVGYGVGSIVGAWDVLRHGRGRARFAALTR
ncbi:MAG: glycosyltransferase family 2 protein [Proteobacteria bacterium]|nr:glycosyltransferase family 2 protein [Pseudomonadota bacterium]